MKTQDTETLPAVRVVTAQELFERLRMGRAHIIRGGAPAGFFEVWPDDVMAIWHVSAMEYTLLGKMIDATVDARDRAAARAYRLKHGYVGRGGYVLVIKGVGAGFTPELSPPHHIRRGVRAYPEDDGPAFVAILGNDKDGAERWTEAER